MSLFLLIDEKTIAFLIYVISLSIIESNFLIIMVHYFWTYIWRFYFLFVELNLMDWIVLDEFLFLFFREEKNKNWSDVVRKSHIFCIFNLTKQFAIFLIKFGMHFFLYFLVILHSPMDCHVSIWDIIWPLLTYLYMENKDLSCPKRP